MKTSFKTVMGFKRSTTSLNGFTSAGAVAVDSYIDTPAPRTSSSGGSSGGNGNQGGNNGNNNSGGSSGGGDGSDFHCSRQELTRRGYSEDTVNSVTQSGYLTAWATAVLNEQSRIDFERRHPDKTHIKPYQEDDYAFRGKSQESTDGHRLLRAYPVLGKPDGQYHMSIDEIQRKAELRFNSAAHDTASFNTAFTAGSNNIAPGAVSIAVAVKKFVDLPKMPTHTSEARFTPVVVEVEISHTVSGKEQIRVPDFKKGMNYSNEKDIGDLFSWLKFKPGS